MIRSIRPTPRVPARTRALGRPPEAGSSSGRKGLAGQEVLGLRLLPMTLLSREPGDQFEAFLDHVQI